MTTVLAVDDVHENLVLLTQQFEEAGYEVLQARGGKECLRTAQSRVVDCILLDLLMPGFDGLQTLEALKADPATADVPVVLVSARNDEDTIIEALEAGAHDYVTKPISFPLILARTESAIKLRHAALQQERSQSLATIGTLAGGIAHEFNNLNTIIMGNVDLLLKSNELDTAVKRRLLSIHDAAERSTTITRDLLALVGLDTDHGVIEATEITEAINAVFKLCRKQLVDGKVATAVKGHGPDMAVLVPKQALIQILINLVMNASHAVQGCDERKLTISCSARGSSAIVDVIDTGRGISVENQRKIFLPFYSTKGARSQMQGDDPIITGTGLGLTMVSRLLDRYHGSIRVQSVPQRGSCFRLILPLSQVVRPPEPDSSGIYHRDLSGLRVLLADDEESIREIVAYMVEDAGGTVTSVADGQAALALIRQQSFDVAIIDWSMPLMGGREFLESLQRDNLVQAPRVIIASGLIHDEEIRFIREQGVKSILSKPIRRKHLIAALRQIGRSTDP